MLCLLVSYFHHVTIHVIQIIFKNDLSWNSHVFNHSTHQYCNFLCCNVVVLATFYWRRWLKEREQKVRKAIITSKAQMLLLMECTLPFAFCFSCFFFLQSMINSWTCIWWKIIVRVSWTSWNCEFSIQILLISHHNGLYQCLQTLSYVWVQSRKTKCVNYH